MIVSTTKLTAVQFLQLGEDPPGVRLELVDGEIAVTPSPNPPHAYTISQLHFILMSHVRMGRLGVVMLDTDIVVDEFSVRRPDIYFIAESRRHIITRKRITDVPDLCVEVISPSSRDIDRKDKFAQYAAAGVPHYWIIDPELRTFDAFSLSDGRYTATASARDDETLTAPPFADLPVCLGELWL